MRAFILHGKEDLRLGDLPRPTLQPGQALIRVRRVGAFVPKRPFALGHEFAGEVVELGPGVTDLGTVGVLYTLMR